VNKNLANFLSGAFHPLLIPTLLFGFLFAFYPGSVYNLTMKGQIYFIAVIFVTTFLLPSLAILMLKTSNTITSVTLFERRERALPFIIITLVYIIIAYMFGFQRTFNTLVSAVVLGMALISLLVTLITFYFKISVHATTIAGVVGFTLGTHQHFPTEGNFLYIISIMIVLAGLVASSRLALGAHRPVEILGGILLGFFVSLISIYLFL
jgi:membrane-associated phospholipid phosphatase